MFCLLFDLFHGRQKYYSSYSNAAKNKNSSVPLAVVTAIIVSEMFFSTLQLEISSVELGDPAYKERKKGTILLYDAAYPPLL